MPRQPSRSPTRRAAVDPWKGVRIGEAGPATGSAPSPRSRAFAALAHLGLTCDAGTAAADQSDAETVSDTLSAHTAVASRPRTPRGRTSPQHNNAHHAAAMPGEGEELVQGEAAPTQADEATPGYSPVDAMALCDAGPPCQAPSRDHLSWLYVPLLHAAAGSLSADAARAWSSHPLAGDQWAALVMALRHAAPADPRACARLVSAVADLEAHEARRPTVPADHELVNALAAHPSTALTLPTAVALSADRGGYITAAGQPAPPEAFGGGVLATAAQDLAEDMRRALAGAPPPECPSHVEEGACEVDAPDARPSPAPSRRRGRRGRGRGRGIAAHAAARATETAENPNNVHRVASPRHLSQPVRH